MRTGTVSADEPGVVEALEQERAEVREVLELARAAARGEEVNALRAIALCGGRADLFEGLVAVASSRLAATGDLARAMDEAARFYELSGDPRPLLSFRIASAST